MPRRIFLYALLSLVVSLKALAQDSLSYRIISLKNYSSDDGLPGSQVNYIMQDHEGFIWIATNKGVSRFDGQHFKNFSSADGLESNEVFRIIEDHYHRLFFYCDNYRVCYYDQEKFYHLQPNEKVILPPFGALFFNRYNQLCINYQLHSATYNFGELHPAKHRDSKSAHIIYGENGEEVYLTNADIHELQQTLASRGANEYTANEQPYRIEVSGSHLLLITKEVVNVYVLTTTGIRHFKTFRLDADVNGIRLVGHTSFAVTTFQKGVFIINYITGQRNNYLNNDVITGTIIDKEKNIWFGSYDKGVFLSTNNNINLINTGNGLANNSIQKLCVSGDYIFAGHILNAISYIKTKTDGSFTTGKFSIDQGRSDFNRVTNFLPVNNQYLVIGSDNGIFRMKTTGLSPDQWKPELYSRGPVKDITLRHDTIYYLSHRNLRVISDWKKKFTMYDIDSVRITSLAWQNNQPLVGSFYGLYQLQLTLTDNQFKSTPILKRNGINSVKCLAVNGDVCAIGTEDKGVFLYSAKLFLHIDKPNICADNIHRLVWTDRCTLWVCTPNGVSIIKFDDQYTVKQSVTFNTSTGLPSDNVTDIVEKDGSYYIGTDQGIAVINNIWHKDMQKPLLVSMQLSNQNNNFSYGHPVEFSFRALSYKSLGNVAYRFKLTGIDNDWVSSSSGERRFDLLPPGNYQLDAMAVDRFNQVSTPIRTIFTILPLWYQHTWLQVLGLIIIITGASLLIRKYYLSIIQLQKKDFETKLALQHERQRISAEVHDDLGASISGIKLRTELLSQKVTDQVINKEMEGIHEAITDISSQMRLIIWSLDVENDDVNSLILFLKAQSNKLFAQSPVIFYFNYTESGNIIPISGEKRRQIYLLIREALNNIIKHAEAKNAYLTMAVHKQELTIEIRDDGVGFSPDAQNRGRMGIRNIQQRAKTLKGNLKIQSSPAHGTTISLGLNL